MYVRLTLVALPLLLAACAATPGSDTAATPPPPGAVAVAPLPPPPGSTTGPVALAPAATPVPPVAPATATPTGAVPPAPGMPAPVAAVPVNANPPPVTAVPGVSLADLQANPTLITGPVDGFYRGTVTLTDGEPFGALPTDAQPPELLAASKTPLTCPPSRRGMLQIGDSVLVLDYKPATVMVVPIQPPGLLHAKAGDYTLEGTLVDGQLDMTVIGNGCQSVFNFRRLDQF